MIYPIDNVGVYELDYKIRNKKDLVMTNINIFVGLCCILSVNAIANAGTSNISQIKPGYQWQGMYLGGSVGGAWGKSDFATDVGVFTLNTYFSSQANILSVNNSGSHSIYPNAFIGGIEAGNNWVSTNNMLYGLVLDFSSLHINDSYNANNVAYPKTYPAIYSMQTSIKTDWLFTARGRVGLISDRSWPMLYATGGLALTNLQVSNSFSDNATSRGFGQQTTTKNTKAGWTAGVGAELPVIQNVSLGVEYLYVDFGRVSTIGQVTNLGRFRTPFAGTNISPLNTSVNLRENLFKVIANYKF